jgi:hypothetical protein
MIGQWMINLDNLSFDVECPKCGYPFEIEILDARLESRIFCPNCKSGIQLKDKDCSAHDAQEQIHTAMKDLTKLFRNLGK